MTDHTNSELGSEFEPKFGDDMAPFHKNDETLRLLCHRRSTAADLLDGPGPNADQLLSILKSGSRVPDHRRVTPFRFILFEGEGRARAGNVLAEAFQKNDPGAEPPRIEKERTRFLRAPIVVGVVSKVDFAHRTPEWEQILTAGAVCQNILIAASASGFAAQWLTEWCAYDDDVVKAFGLSAEERIAGFIYIGTAKEAPKERARPVVEELIRPY